jgi:hypothetical protein
VRIVDGAEAGIGELSGGDVDREVYAGALSGE